MRDSCREQVELHTIEKLWFVNDVNKNQTPWCTVAVEVDIFLAHQKICLKWALLGALYSDLSTKSVKKCCLYNVILSVLNFCLQ